MSTSATGKSTVPLITIYAVPVDSSTPVAATTSSTPRPTAQTFSVPTTLLTASNDGSTPTFTYRIPGTTSAAGDSPSSQGGQISVGAKVGIGVGCGLLFVSLVLGLFLFYRRRKQKILAQNPNDPRLHRDFSPAPTHTTYEKGGLDSRADFRAEALHNYSIASRLDSSRSGTPASGMTSKMESRSNSRLDHNGNRNESRQTNRSGSPLHRRMPSNNSLYQGRITPSSNKYIAELATPITPSDGYYSPSTIHELDSEKGDIEIQNQPRDDESITDETEEPIVYEIVELPDTSRRSVKDWNRRTASMGSTASRPTIRDVKDHRSIPVPPVPEDQEVQTSWLATASNPTTPIKAKFAS
ncbi:hypothetical protein GLAREA_11600 [Glarea lozoyensis ATCC 20868]|uniref:Uncharacterized protein n=1 Tax=Glarea lozoyensis (strain ATCC 20868 / MF5171) TaxID=1116229 RepID=S3CIC8_GLAL2|nr:uncharacterized protein GLAREA_11600 [Glarea lozoyensis ATCC 20868]EPE25019.1 hypothetical protein GLAREA_11600 [Glarea lozoyensis ATCC 20868]